MPPAVVHLNANQVKARYGNVSDSWLDRRLADKSGFPRPVKLGRLRFWKLADLERWEHDAAKKTEKVAS